MNDYDFAKRKISKKNSKPVKNLKQEDEKETFPFSLLVLSTIIPKKFLLQKNEEVYFGKTVGWN